MENTGNESENIDATLLAETRENAYHIVESVLLATQLILNCTGVNNDNLELEKPIEEEKGTEEKEDLQERITKNSISDSHHLLMTIQRDASFEKIMSFLSRNDELLEKYAIASTKLSSKDRNQIINIQLSLGYFLQTFQQSVVTPVFIGAAKYHCHNLNLLRTLSSLFVGLFIDGYCRPAEETTEQIQGEDKDVSGTGFGDVGDGDISSAQNVSVQIEDEEQLIGLQDDNDINKENKEQNGQDKNDKNN